MVQTVSTFGGKSTRPGLKESDIGLIYKKIDTIQSRLYYSTSSKLEYEEALTVTDMPTPTAIDEMTELPIGDQKALYEHRIYLTYYGLRWLVTDQARTLVPYASLADASKAGQIANSFAVADERFGHYLFNNCVNSNSVGADGQYLLSFSHPIEDYNNPSNTNSTAGTIANMLPIGADLTDASLKDAIILVHDCRNNTGKPIQLEAQKLFYSTKNNFIAQIITKSELQSGTAENDMNAIKGMRYVPELICSTYLRASEGGDDDAFFILTDGIDNGKGLINYKARPLTIKSAENIARQAQEYSAVKWESWGYHDWRGVFGMPGMAA